jgi:hypothetical protein
VTRGTACAVGVLASFAGAGCAGPVTQAVSQADAMATGDAPSAEDPSDDDAGQADASMAHADRGGVPGDAASTRTDGGAAIGLEADAGLVLSDDFESAAVGGPPSPALWTVVSPSCSGSGTLAIDDSQAHSGRHSVRVEGGGGYCDHVFFSNSVAIAGLGSDGGQVYARFFVRLTSALGQGHTTFLAMADDSDDDGGAGDLRMGGQDAILMYNRQSDDATLPTLSPAGVSDSVAIAAATWTCVELHVDETAGTIDTWVNGAEVPGLVEDGTPVADISTQWLTKTWRPSLVSFGPGWESYAGQAMTLWFDDVALAPFRIGCGT